MCDDTFNPLGIQGGGVHPHERTFFWNFETAPVNKVSLIFSSQNHTPLWPLPMLQWLILNCNQTLQVNFLAYYNNLFLLDKRSLLMKSFPFLMTGITKLCTQTQLHPPLPSSIHLHPAPSTSTQLHPPPPSSFQPPPSSIHLHPAHFSLHPALCNTLNNIWTKILHVIGQFPQI